MSIIYTERLKLRPVAKDDVNFIYTLYSSNEVCKYYDLEPFSSNQEAESHTQRWLELKEQGKQCRFIIQNSEQLIGTCGLYLINNTHKRACIGYDLLPEFWGNGYMQEALISMLQYSHDHYGIQRFQAEVLEDNLASIKLLEKIGFNKEGLLKKNCMTTTVGCAIFLYRENYDCFPAVRKQHPAHGNTY